MNAIGSHPGDEPSRLPVSHSDHGADADGQNASPLGRTCTKIVLWCWATARSSQLRYSALTRASGRPGRLGKSMLVTVVSQKPRTCRAARTGTPAQEPTVPATGAGPPAKTGPAAGG